MSCGGAAATVGVHGSAAADRHRTELRRIPSAAPTPCQGLNYIVAVLLLALERDEEEAFWLLAAIVERISYKASFGANLQGCHVEMKTLQVRTDGGHVCRENVIVLIVGDISWPAGLPRGGGDVAGGPVSSGVVLIM